MSMRIPYHVTLTLKLQDEASRRFHTRGRCEFDFDKPLRYVPVFPAGHPHAVQQGVVGVHLGVPDGQKVGIARVQVVQR